MTLSAALACGGGKKPYPSRLDQTGGATASGGQPAGGAAGSSTATSVYANADEGAFPKDRVLNVEISMPEAAWETAIQTAEGETYTRVAVRIDGQDLGEVGFRFKGSYSLKSCVDDQGALICEKLSQKLRFTEYDADKRFYGLKRLNLNALLNESNLTRERLGYRLYRDMGIIAPRTSYAVVKINGKSEGLFHVVEDIDGRFTDDRFAKGNRDGNLYKEGWPDHTDDSYYSYHLATSEASPTHLVYESFSREMLAATDAELPTVLSKWVDLDYFLRYMAVDYAIANWDGITTFYCGDWGCANHNYFMYEEQLAPKFWLIPWDLNATFSPKHWLGSIVPWNKLDADCGARVPGDSGTTTTRAAACDPTIRAIALSRDGYHAAVQQLLDQYFIPERLNAQIDETVALLTPYVETDPYLAIGSLSGSTNYLKNQILELRARLEAVLAE